MNALQSLHEPDPNIGDDEKRKRRNNLIEIITINRTHLLNTDLSGADLVDNPDDFVRLEIAAALQRDIRVIPVLVDGALMPQSRDLPDDLKTLVELNALQLQSARVSLSHEELALLLGGIEVGRTRRKNWYRKEILASEKEEEKAGLRH